MDRHQLLAEVKAYIAQCDRSEGLFTFGVRNIGIVQTNKEKLNTCSVVEPVIGLVLQGRKTAQYGTKTVHYAAGDSLIVGQVLPTVSSVINATPDIPFISAYIAIDLPILRSLYSDMGLRSDSDITAPAFEVGAADAELIEAIARLFRLRRDPLEEQALGDCALREVYFRALRSKHGRALLQMIQQDSRANQIAKAIAHIRKEYRNTIRAEDLASIAGMSASVFYEHFKHVTANSPLQYQKDLRLHEAHNLLTQARRPISEIAHSVGYESAAQFSRDFSRKFGASPRSLMAAQS